MIPDPVIPASSDSQHESWTHIFYLNNSVMSPRIKNMSPEFMLVITEIKNRNGVGNHKIYNFKCMNHTTVIISLFDVLLFLSTPTFRIILYIV